MSSLMYISSVLLYVLLECVQNGSAYPAEKMIKSGDSAYVRTLTHNPKTLIICEDDDTVEYSDTYEMLKDMGHQLTTHTIKTASSEKFREFDEFTFDNLILLTDTLGLNDFPKDAISADAIKRFVDAGKNVIITATASVHASVLALIRQMGVDADPKGSIVSDAFAVDQSDVDQYNTRFKVKGVTQMSAFLGLKPNTAILYEGSGHFIPHESKPQVLPILIGNPTSISHSVNNPDKTYNAGERIGLVSVLQGLNSARVLISGSQKMFSNNFFELNPANKDFVRSLLQWISAQKGVIRWSNFKHNKVGEKIAPYMYTVNDMVNVQLDLHEHDGQEVKPYISDDLQVEFVMLDPYLRIFLRSIDGTSTYSATFKAPDKYGIFKFRIDHKRVGYNHLHLESVAPLRNFKHNDYERFIWCASPYYAAAFCSMLSVLIVSYVFLYHSKHPVKGE